MTPEPVDPRHHESGSQRAETHDSAPDVPVAAPLPSGDTQPPSFMAHPSVLVRQHKPWQFKLLNVSLALFCLEVGAFLIVVPQQDSWNLNYFSGLSPWVQDVWDAAYFRWAVSGVGVLNLYVAFLQIRNLFRS